MKNRLYYVLFLLYAIVVAFILYVNGVFTGGDVSLVNLFRSEERRVGKECRL